MQLFSRAEKFQAKHFDVVSQEAFPVSITNTVDDKNINTVDDKKEEEGEEHEQGIMARD